MNAEIELKLFFFDETRSFEVKKLGTSFKLENVTELSLPSVFSSVKSK